MGTYTNISRAISCSLTIRYRLIARIIELRLHIPEQVAKAHELGKLVFVYTVDEADEMRQVEEAGIDGMVSDRPSLLKELLAEFAKE